MLSDCAAVITTEIGPRPRKALEQGREDLARQFLAFSPRPTAIFTANYGEAGALAHFGTADILLMTAAVADFRPTTAAPRKLKKRESLTQIEARYGVRVMVARDDTLIPPNFRLERLRPYEAGEAPPLRAMRTGRSTSS